MIDNVGRLATLAAWREKNREKIRAYARAWEARNPDKRLGYQRKRRSAFPQDLFAERLAAQGGRCAICGRPLDGATPHADHTGRTPRGVLCGSCNRGLGYFHDDPAALRAAADYVESYA